MLRASHTRLTSERCDSDRFEWSFRNFRIRSVRAVTPAQSHYLLDKSVVLIVLVAVWTGMAVLARRPNANVSARFRRVALTLAVAVTAALFTWMFWREPQPQPSDLGQVWAGSRALLHGQNPYEAVGPGRAFEWPFPLL